DLLATKGYRTTWGAGGFESQMIDEDATVVKRLDEAGAVLVAKLTLGALALGDVWFGGVTRNPWNTNQGSSGSSAGPASATAEGDRRNNHAALAKLREMGVNLLPVEMPKFPYDAMITMLTAESAAAFDELTRTGKDKLLTSQKDYDWPNTFRTARFIPAVEYIQAARARRMAMDAVAKV